MKHLILVKCNEEIQDITRFAEQARAHFDAITQVEGVHAVKVIEGVRERANRYHVMIEIDMDKQALPAYNESACHHEWKEKFGRYIEKKTIFDYE